MITSSSANKQRGYVMVSSNSNIANASEEYRKAVKICREVFSLAGRNFIEPQGVRDLLQKARALYTDSSDEAAAVTEVDYAIKWLNGVAAKFLRGGIDYFEGKLVELSYMSLDRDIMENMEAQMRDYCAAVTLAEEDLDFALRIEAYRVLAASVNGARQLQCQRVEERERLAHEEVQRQEEERRARRRQLEEQAELARQEQEAAKAAARVERQQQFDELFS